MKTEQVIKAEIAELKRLIRAYPDCEPDEMHRMETELEILVWVLE